MGRKHRREFSKAERTFFGGSSVATMKSALWSPLNTEPWCTVFCRLFDMAPHLGTFLILMKVSEKFKKMCLPWPRIWAGPCYRMPRYYIHETIRLFLVLVVFYQVWFQFWYAIGLVLVLGYGYKEHRVKRNIIPATMLVMGVMFYVVCWCGLFGRKQDGSHAAAAAIRIQMITTLAHSGEDSRQSTTTTPTTKMMMMSPQSKPQSIPPWRWQT